MKKEFMLKELEHTQKLLSQNRHQEALDRLKNILKRRGPGSLPETRQEQSLFISAAIKFSEVALLLGKELEQTVIFSEHALEMAGKLDEQRRHIQIQLIRGLLFMVLSRFPESFSELSKGTERAKELDDDDIIHQTSEYFALFFFMQGRYRETLKYAEYTLKTIYNEGDKSHRLPPIIIGALSAAYLGQFHRAIGMLDFHCHFTGRLPYYAMTTDTHVTKAVLGTVLDLADKSHAARLYLNRAKKESSETGNLLGQIFSLKGLAFHYFKKGKVEKAVKFMEEIPLLAGGDTFRSIMPPWFLEMYHEFEKQGYGEKIGWRFETFFNAVIKTPDIHMRGVCLRLRALDALSGGENIETVLAYLAESES